ncbi:unnamed protein product [Phytophthora lilii]|uniref:Unnamed protein product n=1 Tax=Phytophthora lilii TaxID=2077276 RepID=A0A9W6XFA0_9STRA|nr:unnamed protein product [Phytophthora lilii]
MPVLLEFGGENLNMLVTTSISTQFDVVLSIENYVGRVRSLVDQFRPKTPPAAAIGARSRARGIAAAQVGTSVAHYDESGMLASRTCAVCDKIIRLSRKSSKRMQRLPSLLCARDGCGQMLHLKCSRWSTLSEEAIATISEAGKLDAHFFCDVCVLKAPLSYWDFLATHLQHELLLTENLFNSVGIARVPLTPTLTASVSQMSFSEGTETETSKKESRHSLQEKNTACKSVADFDKEDRSPWPSVMLFDRTLTLLGVGDKSFHIPATSRDPEMYIVVVTYVALRAYPATQQQRAIPPKGNFSTNEAFSCTKWEVSYARQGSLDIPLKAGNAIFWPSLFTRDVLALEYTRRSFDELEHAFLYEFQGEQPHDKAFSIGCNLLNQSAVTASSNLTADPTLVSTAIGIWMNLTPRKGICMKLLAAQLGHAKTLREVHILHVKTSSKPKASKAGPKLRKPHFPGQQLNKIAVDTAMQ